MSKTEELIERFIKKGFYPTKGTAADVRKLASMLKLAMERIECEYPENCPDPTNGELCWGCNTRSKIEAIAKK